MYLKRRFSPIEIKTFIACINHDLWVDLDLFHNSDKLIRTGFSIMEKNVDNGFCSM